MKQRTPAVRAATAYNRIVRINQDQERDLSEAPETIRAKHETRRQAVLEKLDPEAREFTERMLGESK